MGTLNFKKVPLLWPYTIIQSESFSCRTVWLRDKKVLALYFPWWAKPRNANTNNGVSGKRSAPFFKKKNLLA